MQRTLTTLLATALAAFGCDDDPAGSTPGDAGFADGNVPADMGGDMGDMGMGGAGGEGGMGGAGGMAVGTSALRGRIDADAGNQSTAGARAEQAAAIRADQVAVVSTTGAVLAEAAVDSQGRFEIGELDPIEAPFMIEATLEGEVVGRVLVPADLDAGREMAVMPISQETSVEAMLFAALQARGEAIDPIGLIAHVSQEMAAAYGDDVDALSPMVLAAQAAFTASLDTASAVDLDLEALRDARMDAFVTLSSALDAADDAEAEAEAWAEWFIADRAALDLAFQVSAEAQSEARAAASLALALQADADAEAEDEAGRFAAAQLASELTGRARAAAIGTLLAGDAAAVEAANAAFVEFAASIRAARDLDGLLDAESDMRAALLEADGLIDTLSADLDESRAVGIEAILGARSSLEVTAREVLATVDGAGADLGAAMAAGYREIRDFVGVIADGQLGAEADGEASLMAELVTHLVINPAEVMVGDVDLEGGRLDGDLLREAPCNADDLSCGALSVAEQTETIIDGIGRFDTAEGARLVVRAGGDVVAAVAGTASADGFDVDLPVEALPEGITTVEIISDGQPIGGLLVESPAVSPGMVRGLQPVTLETTVEAMVAAVLDAREAGVDRSGVLRFVDDAVARAGLASQQQFDALVEGVAMAQAVNASLLETDASALDAAGGPARAALEAVLTDESLTAGEAHAEFVATLASTLEADDADGASRWAWVTAQAAAAFEMGARAQGLAGAALATTADGRAQLETAMAGMGAIEGRLVGAVMPFTVDDELDGALTALTGETFAAVDAEGVRRAGDAFADALTGPDGVITAMGAEITDGDVLLEATFDAALVGAIEATEAREAVLAQSLEATLADHSVGGATSAAVSGTLDAFAGFDAALPATFDVLALDGLSAADLDLLTTTITMTSLGLFGAF